MTVITATKSPKQSLQSRIDRLAKSTSNVVNAKNAAQREAAEKFLVMRAQELDRERKEREEWLHEADEYARKHMPEISTDAAHENNRMWVRKMNEYTAMCDALNAAWRALMASKEAA